MMLIFSAAKYRDHVRLVLILFGSVFLLDQMTKRWALHYCSRATLNRGISWSLFDSPSPLVFWTIFAVIAICILLFMCHAYRLYRERQSLWGAALVLAGGLSNMLDRYLVGGVIDFIAISFGTFDWPIFNGADVAIFCGILYLAMYNE